MNLNLATTETRKSDTIQIYNTRKVILAVMYDDFQEIHIRRGLYIYIWPTHIY